MKNSADDNAVSLRLGRDLETGGEIELGGVVFPVEPGEDERDAYADAMQTGQEWLDEDCRS